MTKPVSLFLLLAICLSIGFTGCGQEVYSLTEDEETTIALYAAKIVTKYNINQTTGICNARIKAGELDAVSSDASDTTDASATYNESTGELIAADNTSSDAGYSFTDAIGIEGMDFTCSTFDVCSEFQASKSFILTEESGKKYLILYIDGINNSSQDIDFSALGSRTYNLSINSSADADSQLTILNNDLTSYSDVISAGDSKSFVLVFQFANSDVENITSLQLNVTSDGSTRGTTL